jgi:FkbM family methyltransferase
MIPLLGTLVLNRGDLLERMVASIDYPVDKLVIIQNSSDAEVTAAVDRICNTSHAFVNSVYVERPFRNIGCCPGWNRIIKGFPECEYWIIANNDTLFLPGDLEKYVKQHNEQPNAIIAAANGSFSCFLLTCDIVYKVGLFDENIFPIYNEDIEYMYRLKNARIPVIPIDSEIGESNNGSWTIRSSESYANNNRKTQLANQTYVAKKWGTNGEYIYPWNNQDLGIDYWLYDPYMRKQHSEIWNNMEDTANKYIVKGEKQGSKNELADIISRLNLVTDKNSLHSYCDHFYEQEFKRYKDKPIKLVEIGVDQGGSLIMWANYFPQAQIAGADLQWRGNCVEDCKNYNNISLLQCNAYDYAFAANLQMVDILIDDGPHSLDSQLFTIKVLSNKINPGGILVIEDIENDSNLQALVNAIPFHLKSYAEVIDLRSIKNRYDDLMLVIRYPESLNKNIPSKNNVQVVKTGPNDDNIALNQLLKNPTGLSMDMMSERLSHLLPYIKFSDIKNIIDVGAAHGFESINLARAFQNAKVWGFEPTPEHYKFALDNYSKQPASISNRIALFNLALNDTAGRIKFYPLDENLSRGNNTGMASKFKLMNPQVFPHELNVQKEILVDATTLNHWCSINNVTPDIIWMDAQGAELDILKGASQILTNVKVIMTEAALKPYYHGHTLKVDIDAYLSIFGFKELVSARKTGHEYEVDAIYIKQ